MRVFITGASGFIGKALVKSLLDSGHQVLGLARSDKSAAVLTALGAEVQRGDIDNHESLKQGATTCDAVVHLAFKHDTAFTDYEGACRVDQAAIKTIGNALVGTNRPFLITSGTLALPQGRPATEDDDNGPQGFGPLRGPAETLAMSFVEQGVRAMAVRLPPTNHGDGDHGFMAMLIKIAREKGSSAYIGDGANVWPATHVLDTAKVYQLAVEKGAAGTKYHAVAEEGVPAKDIATAIGKKLNLPVVSKTKDEASAHFGWAAQCFGLDNLVSSERTKRQLGWMPAESSLLADLEHGTYFV